MSEQFSLWSLFFSALISSTLAPGGSEVLLLWLANNSGHSDITLLCVASVGNILGGASSFLLGYLISRFFPSRFKDKPKTQQAMVRLKKWGSPLLFFSWLPLIGDPLCLAAGWLRMAWIPVMLFIALGKVLRYYLLLTVGG